MTDRASIIAVLSALVIAAGGAALGMAGQAPWPEGEAPIILAQATGPSAANTFNRLMKRPSSEPYIRPSMDGIHDPANPGTALLQWPSEAFAGFPKTNDGNRVDWVQTLAAGLIRPWTELEDPEAEPFLMDLVIVRQVKGSMPNVVYTIAG